MKKFVWIGLGVITLYVSFTLRQLSASHDQPVQQVAINTPPSALINGVKLEPIRTIVSHTSSSSTPIAITPVEKLKSSSAHTSLPKAPAREHSSVPNHASADLDTDTIDRLVSAPFNQIVKEQLVGEGDKERFKRFANATDSDEWDIAMENHLYDGIISHALAKFISVQSIKCRAGICELQIYEDSNEAWSKIIADLGEQSWWDFQSFSTYSFVAMVDL